MEYSKEKLIQDINEAERVLVGIGKEFCLNDNINSTEVASAYEKLAVLLKDKEYFVVTLTTDDIIYTSSVDTERIVAPCGSINRYQCNNNCEDKIYTLEDISHTPVCPVCNGKLVHNTVEAEVYNEKGYLDYWQKYTQFLQNTLNKKTVLLELGVGMQFPGIIRFPFEKTCFYNNKAILYRINGMLPQVPVELAEKAYEVNENAVVFCRNEFVI